MHWRIPICMVTMVLWGCKDKEPGVIDSADPDLSQRELFVSGQAPWDPMRAEVEPEEGEDYIVAAEVDGEALDEELTLPSVGGYAWRSSAGLEAGEHTITHPEDATISETVTVVDYGRQEGFDAKTITGVRYALDLKTVWTAVPAGLGDLLLTFVDGVWLTVEEVDGEEALFVVDVQMEGESVCRALRGWGTLSETGELSWEVPLLELEFDQGNAPLEDLHIRGGWLADGSVLGGAESGATLHTGLLSRYLMAEDTGLADEGALCETLAGFGIDCYDCDGDGELCADLQIHAGLMYLDEGGLSDEPASCGVDLEDAQGSGDIDIPPIECEIPDFSCALSFFGLLGLTGWLRRRDPDPASPRHG